MRTHGWGGNPPASDQEAVQRIVQAAVECVEQSGDAADIAKVAFRLGVTRQTVYRYFSNRSALFEAVAGEAAGALVDRLTEHLAGIEDASDAIVEVVYYCLRNLPSDPRLSFIARPGHGDALITSTRAPGLATLVLAQLPIDLHHLDDVQRAVLAEHMVRLLQALLLDPATAARDDAELRRFLDACLRPTTHPQTMHR